MHPCKKTILPCSAGVKRRQRTSFEWKRKVKWSYVKQIPIWKWFSAALGGCFSSNTPFTLSLAGQLPCLCVPSRICVTYVEPILAQVKYLQVHYHHGLDQNQIPCPTSSTCYSANSIVWANFITSSNLRSFLSTGYISLGFAFAIWRVKVLSSTYRVPQFVDGKNQYDAYTRRGLSTSLDFIQIYIWLLLQISTETRH
jgi:hypothetical protein